MRTLDVGVAAGYAILCISLVAALSPYSVDGAKSTAVADSRASSAAVGYVRTVGLTFLATAPLSLFCSSLELSSNATIVLGGENDGLACRAAPSNFLGSSSLVFNVSGKQVEIDAWVEGQ